ncbi:hypothetical protein ACIGHG_20565 [Bacillus sp. NPDC077411]|uniref:hypothetical protein n=1 Tax=Bacillus sp. NPDC077411 TaxID=3363947 RepID=UPI0037CA6560
MNHQKEYWNEVANEKQFITPFQFDWFSKYVNKEAAILDYGCGYGRTLLELKQNQFMNLYGVFELADGAVLRHHHEERVKEWTSNFQQLEYEKVEYVTMNGNRSNGLVYMGSLK